MCSATCTVALDCGSGASNHTCSTYVGESGAAMFDAQHYVRAVHHLGVMPGISDVNSAVTMTRFLFDNLVQW